MSARSEIAAAASSVAGVAVNPHYRQDPNPGRGFVQLVTTDRDDTGLGFVDTWHVVIMLAQDWHSAETWVDANRAALAAALNPELLVTRMFTQTIQLDNGPSVPCLVVEGTRESEIQS